jgi:hypothetical protein
LVYSYEYSVEAVILVDRMKSEFLMENRIFLSPFPISKSKSTHSVMHTTSPTADMLFFNCGVCHTELSVPLALQGVEGPCPCCGERIQAPLPVAAAPTPVSEPFFLPPLDRFHEPPEADTDSVPVPGRMEERASSMAHSAPTGSLASQSVPSGLNPVNSKPETSGFQAKLTIPQSDEPLDDSWRERHLEERRRQSRQKSLDRAAGRFLDSKGFQIARVVMLVATGGMCAGLVLYLKDRKWVLDLPWKPGRMETIVTTPHVTPTRPAKPVETVDPFIMEDPSEFEVLDHSTSMAPVPEPVSVPVSASPVMDEKKK